MISYFIKSAICLTLLLLFYHLVLEREKMHKFNRFYLLGSVLFSFLAPLFIIYTEASPLQIIETMKATTEQPIVFETAEVIETPVNYFNYFIYFSIFISTILLIRFIKNVVTIYQKTRENCTIKHQKATLVLVDDEISPHTFWNYIFINKTAYDSQKIEEELFTHELTHATQKHTFDVLLIEVLKIVFWFNPIFYFLKKTIQLNHEFLADTKVISNHKNISEYQHLLLNKTAWNNDYYLASNLNYLLTKKRLLMMTKQSSRTKVLLKKLAVIPVTVGFVFLFAERVEAQETIIEEITEDVPLKEGKLSDSEIYKSYFYRNSFNIKKDKNGNKVKKRFDELTKKEKAQLPPPPPLKTKKKVPSQKLIEDLKNNKEYAIWIDEKVVKNEILNNYKASDFSNYSVSFVYKNARSKRFPQEHQASLYTKKYFDYQNKKREKAFLNYLKNEYKIEEITIKEDPKKKYIDAPIKRESSKQSIASESVLDDVKLKLENADALKLSIQNKDTILPPPPPRPASIKVIKKGEKSNIPPPLAPIVKKGEVSNIPPPSPAIKKGWVVKNDLQIIKDENFKNITFYLNGKIIAYENLNKIHPKDIKTTSVKKNKDGSGKIYITTKTNSDSFKTNKENNKSKTLTSSKEKAKNKWVVGNEVHIIEDVNLEKLAAKPQVKTKNNWVVEDEVHIVEDVNTETGDVYKRKDTKEKPTSNKSTEFKKLDETFKKNYFIEDKKTSKKDFFNHLKNNKDYHYGSAYTGKEKTAINLYISKIQDKIIKLMQKGY
ncbi:M56 family metallopeptidase [Tenacibaculum sp. HL-MS23]|uniref:M56 family metallopeptidase n=1 Tax=Tenacibaculum sp. HL-MS23 TaxID=3077734 RepID=UPI0028FC17EC|nr:M56 family metallopeptidase [Tenacibaculum sp. HL-MS23]WNW01514.1 M56 family metallopeptidase [Tenacibaculum sp. HL-MS23]